MGEVYRATDTKLKRQVAIKILPPSFAADHDRLARFQREAEVLASLNHPNIAAIYGLEESGGITALVMELVEGEDLSQRIARGAIPIDEALPIAKQIAEALEAAHEQGIIHRDLKPANIKVRADGTVKVLDFGLAKAMEPTGAMSPSMSMSPTITTPAMTQAGMILGTAAYMSPEQAKGRPVDKRSDVWTFGAVLYEMLTGRRAFSAEDVSETLAAVLMKEPEWTALPATVPPTVVTVLRRCLQKDRKQRVRDIGDVSLALEGAFETAVPQATATSSTPRGRLAWMAFAVAAALAAVLAVRTFLTPEPEAPTVRFDVLLPEGVSPVGIGVPQLSPDGRKLAFVGALGSQTEIWVRSLDSSTVQPLRGTEGAQAQPIFWSADSQNIGFGDAQGNLKKIPASGGPPEVITKQGRRDGAWNTDGVILLGGTAGPLQRVSASGGQPVPETELDAARKETTHDYPNFLPDGRHYLYLARNPALGGGPEERRVYVSTLGSKERHVLPDIETETKYSSTGHVLFLRDNILMAQPFDVRRLALSGEAFPVTEQSVSGVVVPFSVSLKGGLAYRQNFVPNAESQLLWFDRQGKQLGQIGPPALYYNVKLSPDGKLVVVDFADRRGIEEHLWSADPARGVFSRMNPGEFRDYSAGGVASDGRVAFTSTIGGVRGDIYLRLASGAGTAELLVKSATAKHPNHWSLDGRFLIYDDHSAQKQDLWIVPMTGDRKPIPFLVTPADETDANFSPDTRWIAYSSDESGRREVYVQGFVPDHVPAAGIGKWQASTAGGAKPHWRRDGKELYYIASDGKLMAVPVTSTATTLGLGVAVSLFETRTRGYTPYDVAPDGRFLINTVTEAAKANSSPITVVLNWTADLKK